MKSVLTFLLFVSGLLGFANLSAQNEWKGETLFTMVEKMPAFPGGEAALAKFLQKNIEYPQKAKQDGVEGKVYAQFYVTKTGKLEHITIKRGVRKDLDDEVLRVIGRMPKWMPGTQNGQPVHVIFNLPVVFELR